MSSTKAGPASATALPGVLVGLCGLLLTACGIALSAARDETTPTALLSPAGLDHGAALVFVVLGLAVLAWWLFSLLAGVVAELLVRRGHQRAAARAARLSPAFMRRLAAAFLGIHLLVVPVAQAASPVAAGLPGSRLSPETVATLSVPAAGAELPAATWSSRDLPSPAWSPQRPAAPMNRLMGQQNRAAATAESIVVKEGDSLWSIAARSAGASATDAEIAREWPRWYRTNRAAIGPDPDLLDIGIILAPPRAEQDQNRR